YDNNTKTRRQSGTSFYLPEPGTILHSVGKYTWAVEHMGREVRVRQDRLLLCSDQDELPPTPDQADITSDSDLDDMLLCTDQDELSSTPDQTDTESDSDLDDMLLCTDQDELSSTPDQTDIASDSDLDDIL
ncbi:hypothetical protein NEHOM01_2469, partial [Nematocida homosporus]|uniref:uncharacterized protein n=1 Tax=Nematocida homosporus TaxID=1912981 RepID=UPI00221EF2EF